MNSVGKVATRARKAPSAKGRRWARARTSRGERPARRSPAAGQRAHLRGEVQAYRPEAPWRAIRRSRWPGPWASSSTGPPGMRDRAVAPHALHFPGRPPRRRRRTSRQRGRRAGGRRGAGAKSKVAYAVLSGPGIRRKGDFAASYRCGIPFLFSRWCFSRSGLQSRREGKLVGWKGSLFSLLKPHAQFQGDALEETFRGSCPTPYSILTTRGSAGPASLFPE